MIHQDEKLPVVPRSEDVGYNSLSNREVMSPAKPKDGEVGEQVNDDASTDSEEAMGGVT